MTILNGTWFYHLLPRFFLPFSRNDGYHTNVRQAYRNGTTARVKLIASH